MANIAVLGSGGWGCALSIMADKYGNSVKLWSLFENEINDLKQDREHKKLLPGVKISESIELTNDINCVKNADIIVIAVPSNAVRSTVRLLKGVIGTDAIVLNISKGLEEGSLKRLSEVIEEELSNVRVAVLSGPSHAEEVAHFIPTTCVVASKDDKTAGFVQDTLMNPFFRIYTNDDLVGVELGASLKNVIALAAGICDGMGLGDNTKAALMTRGITEIARLGVALGGKSDTFAGLSGIGDLIVTCTSMHSRNRRAGILIGQGKTSKQAIEEIGMTVEGYKTSAAAYELSCKAGVEMPIITEIYNVLYKDKNPKEAIYDLMTRSKKNEIEEVWF